MRWEPGNLPANDPRIVTFAGDGCDHARGGRRRAALIVARIKAGEDPVPEPMAIKLADLSTAALWHEEELDEHIGFFRSPASQAAWEALREAFPLAVQRAPPSVVAALARFQQGARG